MSRTIQIFLASGFPLILGRYALTTPETSTIGHLKTSGFLFSVSDIHSVLGLIISSNENKKWNSF
ncbi:hypothetical protein T06_6909 [Trichinella sp. T6]|nr:hypothetical protein T06_6909 [Trichinella sp. T6]